MVLLAPEQIERKKINKSQLTSKTLLENSQVENHLKHRKMEYFVAQHRFNRLLLLLKQQSECLKSQIFRYATTISTSTTTSTSKCVRDKERDNTKFNAREGHIANCTYQAPFARLVFSTSTSAATAALTDRPVYPHFIHCIKHTANHPPLTRHIRFYCTAKTIRKKMVRHLFFCSYVVIIKNNYIETSDFCFSINGNFFWLTTVFVCYTTDNC